MMVPCLSRNPSSQYSLSNSLESQKHFHSGPMYGLTMDYNDASLLQFGPCSSPSSPFKHCILISACFILPCFFIGWQATAGIKAYGNRICVCFGSHARIWSALALLRDMKMSLHGFRNRKLRACLLYVNRNGKHKGKIWGHRVSVKDQRIAESKQSLNFQDLDSCDIPSQMIFPRRRNRTHGYHISSFPSTHPSA